MIYPSMPREAKFLSSAEVAEILGVTKTTLKLWLRLGKIHEPERNPTNNYRLWSAVDIAELRSRVENGRLMKRDVETGDL